MAMKVRLLLSSVVLLSTMWLISCGHYTCGTTFGSASCTPSGGGLNQGGGGNNIGVTAFEYFMDDTAGAVAAEGLNVSNSQSFTSLPFSVSVVPAQTIDWGVAIAGGKFLYIPFNDNTLHGFSIDGTTGALTPVLLSPYSVTSPSSIVADPKGAFVFVGSATGIWVFSVNADGSLTLAPGSPFSSGGTPTQMATDGAGKYLYAVQSSGIAAFSYAASGVLTPVVGSPFTFSPPMAQVEGDLSGSYLVGTSAEIGAGSGTIDNHVYVFGITPSGSSSAGALTQLTPTATQFSPAYVTVSPNGKFVYTFNETSAGSSSPDPMEGYQLSSTGTLTALSTSPFTALDADIGKFDQSGQFLFVYALVGGIGGSYPYAADPSTGALTSTLPHLGFPSFNFAVTDAP